MNGGSRTGRVAAASGAILLVASAALHVFAGYHAGFPALAASKLDPKYQVAFRIVFLAVAWHWALIGGLALWAVFGLIDSPKFVIMACGLGVVIEAAAGASAMGLFIGNEMIGLAGVLMTIGGWLSRSR